MKKQSTKKENRGGASRNQGRKLKYGEETVKVNYRIPVSMKSALDAYIEKWLQKYLKAVTTKATFKPPLNDYA